MDEAIQIYLRDLERELRARRVATTQDALEDATEFLRGELDHYRDTRGPIGVEETLELIASRFGSAEEIADACRAAEGGDGGLDDLKRRWRFDPAPGWVLRCTRCGRSGPAREASPPMIRIGGFSLLKFILGYCTGCQGLRILRVLRESKSM